MKIAWKNKAKGDQGGGGKRRRSPLNPNLPFESAQDDAEEPSGVEGEKKHLSTPSGDRRDGFVDLVESFRSQGNRLAEDGKFHEALGKWDTALTLAPKNAILHEQKAQVLLEVGDAWNALRAAAQATELEPSWSEAWVTLGRAQLNYGEPELSIESFDRALALKADLEEAQSDRGTAVLLIKKRKLLQESSPSSVLSSRYKVRDGEESDKN